MTARCDRCHEPSLAAALTTTPAGERLCPACMHQVHYVNAGQRRVANSPRRD